MTRLVIAVSYDEHRGYVATIPNLPTPATALSLSGLRRCIEAAMIWSRLVRR